MPVRSVCPEKRREGWAFLSLDYSLLCLPAPGPATLSGPGFGTWMWVFLMSEGYPTAARATAQNVLWNAGRAVGGFGPLVIGSIASAIPGVSRGPLPGRP